MRGRKLNIYLAFVTQSYLAVPKTMRLDLIQYFNMKISRVSKNCIKAFIRYCICKKCTEKTFFFNSD